MSVPGMWANLNAGNANAWSYEPDLSRPARGAGKTRSGQVRLTWQMSPNNKLTGFWDEQWGCSGARWPGSTEGKACRDNTEGWIIGGSATTAPETATYSTPPNRITQVNWVDTLSNKALLDVGLERVQQPMGRRSRAWQSNQRSDCHLGAGRKHPRACATARTVRRAATNRQDGSRRTRGRRTSPT